MRPISFTCNKLISSSAAAICADIADLDRWRDFKGYGILPGIASAAYEVRTADMVGSRVRVRSTDGSGHSEEFYLWQPGQQLAMKFADFTPPLQQLATHFTEEWTFAAKPNGTLVTRHFNLYAKNGVTRPLLWLISLVFRRAIDRHLAEMAAGAERDRETGRQGDRETWTDLLSYYWFIYAMLY